MIEAKYAARQICMMTDPELRKDVAECLMRIHVITGWNLPDDVEYVRLLTDEFLKKLKESYDMLNFQEITAAFRRGGIGKKDWGKNMNLDLVCEVLTEYCNQRARVSFEEERLAGVENLQQRVYTDEQITNERRGHIEAAYQCMRNGRVPVMHIYFPEVLHMDELIPACTQEAMNEFFVRALGEQRANIYKKDDQ